MIAQTRESDVLCQRKEARLCLCWSTSCHSWFVYRVEFCVLFIAPTVDADDSSCRRDSALIMCVAADEEETCTALLRGTQWLRELGWVNAKIEILILLPFFCKPPSPQLLCYNLVIKQLCCKQNQMGPN